MQSSLTRAGTRSIGIAALAVITTATTTTTQFRIPFGKWDRESDKPIISPQGNGFESAGTFNPTVVKYDGKFVMLYRAQDLHGKSSLGYASSDDGVHFVRRSDPVMVGEAPYETGGGVEDPRLVKIGNSFYLTYTAYNNQGGQGAHTVEAREAIVRWSASRSRVVGAHRSTLTRSDAGGKQRGSNGCRCRPPL